MTSRRPVKCSECGTVTTTRTSMGHLDYQEFAFPCPKCQVEIRFGMNLFPQRASWEYNFVKNGEWVNDESPDGHEVRFDSENLCSRLPRAAFMPFMETAFFAKDFEKSRTAFGRRFAAVRDGWPVLEKLLIHELNGNLALFNDTVKRSGGKKLARSNREMTVLMVEELERFGSEFFLDEGYTAQRIHALIKATKGKASLQTALAYYQSERRLETLWRELTAIRKTWSTVYYIVAPVYWGLMWDEKKASLDDYTLCQKRFDELKPFFADCHETFCRLAVVGAAFEGVATLDQFVIPFPASPRPVGYLEMLPNGNKHTLLAPLQHGDIFISLIDTKLRNGVGHHAAHYDVTIDCIGYRNHSPSRGVEEFSISYVRFCEKLVRLYGQLEACAPLIHFMRIIDRK